MSDSFPGLFAVVCVGLALALLVYLWALSQWYGP